MERLTEAEVVARYPEVQFLIDIRNAGWIFQLHNFDSEPALVGYRNWPAHIDAVWIFDRNRCVGIRSVDDAPGWVGGTIWQYQGDLATVVYEILGLPQPSERFAPSLILPKTESSIFWTP
jgi:hypothetical protein